IVAFVNGEYTLKRFHYDKQNDCVWLLPANSDYPPIKVTKENDFMIWGVLTYNIKNQLHHK
ncbi:MAG: S24 family peptidase, partial [Prevotellaceae bacterium]|nr:S24 family peptidase [Prevotellaceae bacterium]